uniref:Rbsa n=1 Tax=Plasmodium vivax TaxID=5855 RepID=A0A1Y0JYB3_PLAVI|nr:rbsa [Plasmodium vivax]
MKGIMNGSLCLRKISLCSIFVLAYLSSAKCAYRDESDILYSDDSRSDLASNGAPTDSYESLTASSESLAESNDAPSNSYESFPEIRENLTASEESLTSCEESLTGSNESLTGSNESLTGSNESLTGSNESLTESRESLEASRESLRASRESLAASRESLNDFCGSEESVACEGEPNEKTFMGDVLSGGECENSLSREDLFHIEVGSEESLDDASKYNFQKDLSTSDNSSFEDDQSLKRGLKRNSSVSSLDSDMGSYKNGRSRDRLDIYSDLPRRLIHGDNAPQEKEKCLDFKELLERERNNHQRNSVNIKLKNIYGEEQLYNVKKDSFIVKLIYYLPFGPIVTMIMIGFILLWSTPSTGFIFIGCSSIILPALLYAMHSNKKQFERVFGKGRKKPMKVKKGGGKISRFFKEVDKFLFDDLDGY